MLSRRCDRCQIFFNGTHGLRAMTGAPWPPGSLDSSRRGQTCRVVFVGQMTSRRSGESLRDRIGTARPRGRPEGPHIPGRLSSERTRGRRHRHSGQPTRAPTTRAAADPNPSPIPNLSLLLNTARKRPRRRGPRVFPAPNTKRSPSILPVNVVPMSGVGSGHRTHSSHRTESQTIVGPKPLTRGLDRDHFQSAPLGKGIR